MRGLPSRVKTHQRHSDPGEESSADTQEVLLTSRCALFGLPLRLPARRLARPPAMQDIDAIGMPVRSLSGVLQDVRMIGRQFKVIVLDDFGIVFRPHCQTTTRPSPASSSSVMTSRTVAIARRLETPPATASRTRASSGGGQWAHDGRRGRSRDASTSSQGGSRQA